MSGGGTVLIGGDYQGNNPDVQNASQTVITSEVSIKADATEDGDGGKVIVWSDDATRYYGDISATGGSESGDGGFVEVSGKEKLGFNGTINVTAENGADGSILLDPRDIIITDTTTTDDGQLGDSQILFADDNGWWCKRR